MFDWEWLLWRGDVFGDVHSGGDLDVDGVITDNSSVLT